MRLSFRVLLPAAQAAFTIALALNNFGVVPFRAASRCDWEPSAYCGPVVVPAAIARLVESNLPAVPVLALPYVWLGSGLTLRDLESSNVLVARRAIQNPSHKLTLQRYTHSVSEDRMAAAVAMLTAIFSHAADRSGLKAD
jgi:hypothetical protein